MEWLKLLNIEHLPEHYQDVAEVIGLENTIKLAEKLHGAPIYFKNPEKLFLPVKVRYIRENFNGCNHRRLALATGLTERYVYQVLERKEEEGKQGELFGG